MLTSLPKVSGFTIIRNGVEYDFPFIESIKSILPVVDELIINIGISTDNTKEKIIHLIKSLSEKEAKKIKTFDSEWPLNDPEKKKGGRILAEQTNLALEKCTGEWCFYIQADELLHEEDYDEIKKSISEASADKRIDAIVFQYVHFYGNYNVIQTSRSSYRREIRIIKNKREIQSTGDAQSFRHLNGTKCNAILSKARIFHYGWVRPQETMKSKTVFMDSLYHSSKGTTTEQVPATGTNYVYKRIVGLRPFLQTHPKVMEERVRGAPRFDFSTAPKVFHIKDTWKIISGFIEKITGYRPFEFKNYKLIK